MCYFAGLETAHNAARCLPIHADVVPLLIRGLGCYTSRVDVRLVYHITHESSCAPKAGIFSTDALYINHGIRTVVSPCSVDAQGYGMVLEHALTFLGSFISAAQP